MITFQVARAGRERVSFAASPLLEAVLSLHVVVEPKHHPLQQHWARSARRLSPGLRAEIGGFAFAYRSYFPQFCIPPVAGALAHFDDEINGLTTVPDELIALEFSRPLHGCDAPRDHDVLQRPETRDAICQAARALPPTSRELALLALDEPRALMERFQSMLARYWEEVFDREWSRLEPRIAEGITEAGRVIATSGLFAFLDGLRPEVRVDRSSGSFSLDRVHDHMVDLTTGGGLLMVPSVYVWPHVRVNCDGPWPSALVYAAPSVVDDARAKLPSQDLLKIIRSLGADTRLRALRLVAQQPRSTRELASLLNVSEAAMCRHLRGLADAGVISAHRDSYYILYEIERDRIADLSAALLAFLTASGADADCQGPS